MRNLYLLCFLLCVVVSQIKAQNPTPNAGFENWTLNNNSYYTPDNWTNLNPETAFVGVLTCLRSDSVHSGSYAAELITKIVFGDTANGIITTGKINITSENVSGGIPYTLRPDSMYGWYEYYPAKGDSTDIQFGVYDNSGNTIGLASFTVGDTISTYTRFSVPIAYYSVSTPDTSRWLISSSNGYKSFPGSTLYIDDIGVAFNNSGIDKPVMNAHSVSIVPNPASGYINISNPQLVQGTVLLFNEIGIEVKQFQLNSVQQSFDVRGLAAGNYLYSINSKNGNNLVRGTIILK